MTEQVLELAIDKVIPDKDNPRGSDIGDVAELAESIKAQGIVEPLIVTENGQQTFYVVAGHRRLAAAKLAGLKTVPAIAREFSNSRDRIAVMLIENLQRQDLSPLQEARGFQRLADLELSQRQIAAKVGCSQSHVAKRVGLLKLSPSALKTFESGGITAEDAGTLAALPAAKQDRVLKETNAYGSMAQRIRSLEREDEWRKEREAAAKRPKPKVDAQLQASIDKQKAAERLKEKQRREAQAARARIMPKIVSRGERELQYAATALAEQLQVDVARAACDILGLKPTKPKRQYSSIDYRGALAKRASSSKAKAIEVLVALALGVGETHVHSIWSGAGGRGAQHLRLLIKAGYKPNARDRALLKGGRRRS